MIALPASVLPCLSKLVNLNLFDSSFVPGGIYGMDFIIQFLRFETIQTKAYNLSLFQLIKLYSPHLRIPL